MRHPDIDRFFLANPHTRGTTAQVLLLGSGACGLGLSWPRFPDFTGQEILGATLIILALAFHVRAERHHTQAHERTDAIEGIVTTGAYARIRHPLYLSIIAIDLGIALAFGILVTTLLALADVILWLITAVREERALTVQFPEAYPRYCRTTRWRIIPGIF